MFFLSFFTYNKNFVYRYRRLRSHYSTNDVSVKLWRLGFLEYLEDYGGKDLPNAPLLWQVVKLEIIMMPCWQQINTMESGTAFFILWVILSVFQTADRNYKNSVFTLIGIRAYGSQNHKERRLFHSVGIRQLAIKQAVPAHSWRGQAPYWLGYSLPECFRT